MAPEGSKRIEIAVLRDEVQITPDTLSETFLPMQLLYQGKTDCCYAKFVFPSGFHVCHSQTTGPMKR